MSVAQRLLRLLVVAALPVAAGVGARAQSYRISQNGTSLGSFHVALTQGVSGTLSDSSLKLGGIADLSDRLVADPDGYVRSYHLEGTANGAPLRLDVAVQGSQADITVEQGGVRRDLTVPLPGPVVVLDNSMLDGWQILAAKLEPGSTRPQTFAVLVPQVARTGTVTIRAAGSATVPVGDTGVQAERFDASLEVGGQTVGLTLWLDAAGRIVAFEQPSASLRFELETPSSSAAAAKQAAATEAQRSALDRHLTSQRACFDERNVSVRSTAATLAGSLTVPRTGRPAPALLLLPGSGAVDRNGNAPPVIENDMYRQLAYALGCQGYAVLRIDKLGVGASTGSANDVTLQTYVQNTEAWMAFLRSQPGIDASRVGLVGHSEGGLVALATAATTDVAPAVVVLLESPGIPMGRLIVDQIARLAQLRGGSASEVAALRAQTQQAVDAVQAGSGPVMDLTGDLASNPIAAGFAHAAGLLRSEFAADPAGLAARVEAPVLVVQGGKDVQVLPRNGEALAEAAPRATYLYFPALEHDLYEASGSAIDHATPGPGTRISDTLLEALHTYLAGYLMAAG